MKINIPSRLSDDELIAAVKRLAGCEREATVDLITHLSELDKRRLYLGAGFSSLFSYCTEVLRLSNHATFHRILAARKARRFPAILRMLAEGSLNLTSVRLLAPHLTRDNHEELFAMASGKSKRELQKLLARRFPRPDVRSSIRKLPAPRPQPDPPGTPGLAGPPLSSGPPVAAAVDSKTSAPQSPTSPVLFAPAPLPPSTYRPLVTPLAPNRYQITFTASEETREKLQLAQDLLRHAIPSGDPAVIIDRALTASLEDLARQKFAATNRPRPARGTAKGSRDIPASVMRAVWVRDLGRCAFVSKDGRRCNERAFLEFHHHLVPHGIGGPPTASNLELRCKPHNAYEADLYYGPRVSEDFVREAPVPYGASVRPSNSVRTELSRGDSTFWPAPSGTYTSSYRQHRGHVSATRTMRNGAGGLLPDGEPTATPR